MERIRGRKQKGGEETAALKLAGFLLGPERKVSESVAWPVLLLLLADLGVQRVRTYTVGGLVDDRVGL